MNRDTSINMRRQCDINEQLSRIIDEQNMKHIRYKYIKEQNGSIIARQKSNNVDENGIDVDEQNRDVDEQNSHDDEQNSSVDDQSHFVNEHSSYANEHSRVVDEQTSGIDEQTGDVDEICSSNIDENSSISTIETQTCFDQSDHNIAESSVEIDETKTCIGNKTSEHISSTTSLNEYNINEESRIEVISSSCWYIQGEIHEMSTDFLVDTGSTYTVIDEALYNDIPESKRAPLGSANIRLKSANGEYINVLGGSTVDIKLGRQTFTCPVKVVNLGDKSAIIGLDFMEKHNCVLYLSKGIIQVNSRSIRLKLSKLVDSQCARVQISQNTCISPNHEMIIEGVLNKRHSKFNAAIGLVEPTEKLCDATGLLVARSVVSTDKQTIPLRVVNLGDTPVTLNAGHTIALIHPVENDTIVPLASEHNDNESGNNVPEHLTGIIEQISTELCSEQKEKVIRLISNYSDCFMSPDSKLGHTTLVEHTINTNNARPIKQRFRNPPVHVSERVEEELIRMEKSGEIEPSDSPWSSPLVIVPKKDGNIRICVDYRQLNNCCIKDAYPLPKIDECLDSLSGAEWFCTLDLQSGYHQVGMHPKDKAKTAFSTKRGLFQYTVLPFGLCNAPSTFQRLMDKVLNGLAWKRCILYLDDVIVFGPNFDTTLSNLEVVLSRLRNANLKLKPSKCKLFQQSVEFLGHIVSSKGVSCDPKKIEAVKNWPRPKTVKEVRSFLGFAQYYRKFIRQFSILAGPLYDLTKKRVKFQWNDSCEKAFELIKSRLTESPILAYPTRDDKFILDTDASAYGIGGVLSQIQNGQEKVIAYASKTLSSSQSNYCTTMRELLAVVIFTKHFHHYLWGRNFSLRTDHASLTWLTNFKEPTGMLARWLSILGNYDITIEHRNGNLHGNADGLSRKITRKCKRDDCSDCALEKGACVCVITRSQAKQPVDYEHSLEVKTDSKSSDITHCNEEETTSQSVQSDVSNEIDVESNVIIDPISRHSDVGNTVEKMSRPSNEKLKVDVKMDQCDDEISDDIVPEHDTDDKAVLPRVPVPNWLDSWSNSDIQEKQSRDENIQKIILLKLERNDPPDKEILNSTEHECNHLYAQWYDEEEHEKRRARDYHRKRGRPPEPVNDDDKNNNK